MRPGAPAAAPENVTGNCLPNEYRSAEGRQTLDFLA